MKTYNYQQLKAINATDGYFLVLAPPGCGKTDILAERICVAANKGVPFTDMLCLTFTNRASRGMRQRIIDKIGRDASTVFIGNIHRFCSHFLFDNNIVDVNTGTIDEDDQIDIFSDFSYSFFHLRNNTVNREAVKYVDDLAQYIRMSELGHPERLKPAIADAQALYQMAEQCNFDVERLPAEREALRYALLYIQYKKEHNIIDFSDILVDAYNYLLNSDDYKQYPWIQIDEVQDLNPLQLAIADLLTAPNPTVMYLGDEQQAIFSFLGSKLDTLNLLKDRSTLITLNQNFRSPQYIIDMCNQYAVNMLGVDPSLLPTSQIDTPKEKFDLILTHAQSTPEEHDRVKNMVDYYLNTNPGGRLAILVSKNKEADLISETLEKNGISNFKISGFDMFHTRSYKTLTSLYSVLVNDFNYVSWSRLIHGIYATKSMNLARRLILKMKSLMMTPSDLLSERSYLQDFHKAWTCGEMVLVDTETTGFDVHNDDIVQVAAFKIKDGQKIPGSDFNIIMHTDREIPLTLGDKHNPLIEEYARRPHLDRAQGLRMFLEYIGNMPLIGHNSLYDYRILQNNVKRTLGLDFTARVYDTLHIIKCVKPRLKSYRLEYLVETLHLEGKNSHLADEDIEATKSLIDYCVERFTPILGKQEQFLSERAVLTIKDKMAVLGELFASVREYFYSAQKHTIADELRAMHSKMYQLNLLEHLGPKFEILMKYIDAEWPDDLSGGLYDRFSEHITDLTSSINEGDLINSDFVTQRVFIMTVYKAKGLEFEDVIILNAVDGVYPFFKVNKVLDNWSSTEEEKAKARLEYMEDARKFYVAISRAKKRICVSYSQNSENGYPNRPTPFLAPIRDHFHYAVRRR